MGNCFGIQRSGSISHKGSSVSAAESSRTSNKENSSRSNRDQVNSPGIHSPHERCMAEIYPEGKILSDHNLKIFTLGELKSATRNFKPNIVLGEGGFGTVFKGWVDEKTLAPVKFGTGLVVAVKKLNPEGMQGLQEWQAEVNFLGRLCHPNLVKLLGYCCEERDLLLVYEFMQKGSLENHLFKKGGPSAHSLSWRIRIKIAIGAARGLAFLHTSEKQIIYRDFKTSNILLDAKFNAKLSDFGFAKYGPEEGDSHVTTRIIGTYGYAAPEYVATGHLYVNSDVYGFGVVLLEMLSGLRAYDSNRPSKQHNLVEWAKPFLTQKRKLKEVIDSKMEDQYSKKEVFLVADLILKCLQNDPKDRPSMKEIVQILEKVDAIQEIHEGE